jgi:hypothetical protein
VIVWLWDAGGGHGVTGDAAAARKAAEGFLRSGAGSARVEEAVIALSASSLANVHARTGSGWSGRLRDGGVSWRQLDGKS